MFNLFICMCVLFIYKGSTMCHVIKVFCIWDIYTYKRKVIKDSDN